MSFRVSRNKSSMVLIVMRLLHCQYSVRERHVKVAVPRTAGMRAKAVWPAGCAASPLTIVLADASCPAGASRTVNAMGQGNVGKWLVNVRRRPKGINAPTIQASTAGVSDCRHARQRSALLL